ncbi:hypothetical protein [Quadrisphaera sp. KR29]|uniref:hypothetical protein n=1 Tax=Quadrisphaera sp. KR29 TaxID=3461391 RepID=UPI004043AB11
MAAALPPGITPPRTGGTAPAADASPHDADPDEAQPVAPVSAPVSAPGPRTGPDGFRHDPQVAPWRQGRPAEEAPPGWDVPAPSSPRPTAPPPGRGTDPSEDRRDHVHGARRDDVHAARDERGADPTGPLRAAGSEDPWVRAAHAALADLAPGSAVLLTGGTGCLALAHHLVRAAASGAARTPTALTVAVTALAPATVLAGAPGVRLVVIGGEAEQGGPDLVGPAALAALDDLHLDLAVLTPTGLDARGAWAATAAGAALAAAAVARAERTVAVVAPTALGRPGLVRAAGLSALARVVAVPAPGEDSASLAYRLQAVRAGAPSAPALVAA